MNNVFKALIIVVVCLVFLTIVTVGIRSFPIPRQSSDNVYIAVSPSDIIDRVNDAAIYKVDSGTWVTFVNWLEDEKPTRHTTIIQHNSGGGNNIFMSGSNATYIQYK